MCGIAGYTDARPADRQDAVAMLRGMLARIEHRGPDDEGTWVEENIAIGFRRLSIIDLSPAGHQPMLSESGRYVLAFNGEVYNHEALRGELRSAGCTFRGHSDTEVLLALIERLGLEAALKRCVGMFAVVLWDRRERVLQLARDRFGEKPLYYGWHSGRLLFGSELKALAAVPGFRRNLAPEAVSLLLRYGYIPAPICIFAGTRKLPAGTILRLPLSSDGLPQEHEAHVPQRYWSQIDVAVEGKNHPFSGSFADASKELEALISEAVRLQMYADVPFGAFLSGGIDSSTVVALMQAQSTRKIKTFSIGYDDDFYNEAEHARKVAAHLGTDHAELFVGSRDAADIISKLPEMFDEPLADVSQIPTYCVSRLARQQVTVSLSGDGGDEIFGGYPKYLSGQRVASLPLRRAWSVPAALLSWASLERPVSHLNRRLGRSFAAARFERFRHRLAARDNYGIADVLSAANLHHARIARSLPQGKNFDQARNELSPLQGEYLRLAMVLDRCGYLPDDILAKVDRASMAVSLESRAPLLDHRIVEFAASLPLSYLVKGTETKRVLRQVLYRYVPQPLVDRPKTGFGAPLGKWLRSELSEWAFDLLQPGAQKDTFVDLDKGHTLLEEHIRTDRDHSAQLWPVLMLQMWARQWL